MRHPTATAILFTALTACGVSTACAPGGDAPVEEGDAPVEEGDAEATTTPEPDDDATGADPSGPLTMPDWFSVDHDARTVSMTVTVGATPDNNHWNYNGQTDGALAVTVPQGYEVTIDLVNQDPAMGHSLGISREVSDFTTPPAPDPPFDGAITEDAASMITSTMPGETESVTFVADEAGHYSMVCHVPGHSAVGMWLHFYVSADGEAGVRGI